MLKVSFKKAIETLKAANRELDKRSFAIAASRSLNEAISVARTVGRNAVKKAYKIPQHYLASVSIEKATRVSLIAKVLANKTPLPLDAFSPKFQSYTSSIQISRKGEQKVKHLKRRRRTLTQIGVSVEILRGTRKTIPYAFMKAGGPARVFARGAYSQGVNGGFVKRIKRVSKKGSDLPIKPLLGVSVYAAVLNKESQTQMERKVNQVFPRSIERNIKHLLNNIQAATDKG